MPNDPRVRNHDNLREFKLKLRARKRAPVTRFVRDLRRLADWLAEQRPDVREIDVTAECYALAMQFARQHGYPEFVSYGDGATVTFRRTFTLRAPRR